MMNFFWLVLLQDRDEHERFVKELHDFMADNGTPIVKIPSIGCAPGKKYSKRNNVNFLDNDDIKSFYFFPDQLEYVNRPIVSRFKVNGLNCFFEGGYCGKFIILFLSSILPSETFTG